MHPEALSVEIQKVFPRLKKIVFPYYLAGGTALALQIGHRISVDLDFFSGKEIPPTLFEGLETEFKEYPRHILVNNSEQLTVVVGGAQLSFVTYRFPPLFPFVEFEKIKLFSVKEVAAAKAYVLGRRAQWKDYIDVYFLLKEKHVSLEEVIDVASKKYRDEFNGRLFLEQLLYLEDVEELPLVFLKQTPTLKEVRILFENEIAKLGEQYR